MRASSASAAHARRGVWLWHITVHILGPPFGDAKDIDQAKRRFKEAWLAFKARHDEAALAGAYRAMNLRNEPDTEPRRPRRQRFD